MQRGIKVIDIAFFAYDSPAILRIEVYPDNHDSRVKLLIDNNYYEESIEKIVITDTEMLFGPVEIKVLGIKANMGGFALKFYIDAKQLFEDYNHFTNKNSFSDYSPQKINIKINDEDFVSDAFFSYEYLIDIYDEYYKLYSLGFASFKGMFFLRAAEKKLLNILLCYKDSIYRNKHWQSFKNKRWYKKKCFYFKVNGSYLWKIKIQANNTFKSNAAIIPFKMLTGELLLERRKKLFTPDLKATSTKILLINYQYVE